MNEQRLIKTISECLWEVACNNTHDRTLAANIHAAYNELGEQEGWLKPEYATALSEQSELVELKNINAAKGLLHYWNKIFPANNQGSNLVYSMVRCAKYKREDYEFYEKEDVLEEASNHQHNNWREFICYFEPEKIEYS